jgi:alpha-galactosidase
MSGLVGLSGNFIDINEEQKKVFIKYIEFYKRYRNFYKESVIILSDDPKNVGDKDGFYHLQYDNLQTGEQLIFAYRYITASNSYLLRLQNLIVDKMYELFDPLTEDKLGEYSGEYLMYRGLNLKFSSRHSGSILYLKYK